MLQVSALLSHFKSVDKRTQLFEKEKNTPGESLLVNLGVFTDTVCVVQTGIFQQDKLFMNTV